MNTWQIFLALRRHQKLATKRAFNYQQNKVAKAVVIGASGFIVLYLLFIAVMLSLAVNDMDDITAVEAVFCISPFVLTIDFIFRFSFQQTPAQLIKPYVLLPFPKYACIDCFIINSLINTGNLIWFFLLVPFALMSVVFVEGFAVTLGFLLCYYMLILANSQWYLFVRTLITGHIWYCIVPILFYALLYSPIFIWDWDTFFSAFKTFAQAIEHGHFWPYLVCMAWLALTIAVNRPLQYRKIKEELGHVAKTKVYHINKFNFLDRYGVLGQYVKLELKTCLRNKNPRKLLLISTAAVIVLSLLITYTNVYNDSFFTDYWCIYNFAIYGSSMLSRIMGHEGNYIDCIMTHKENILQLLRAKFVFYSALLLIPFMLMLPPVFAGKWSLLMLVSYVVFTIGFQHCLIMQLAIYARQTIPLNQKLTSKNGVGTNYVQVLIPLAVFFLPIVTIKIIQTIWSDTTAYIIFLCIGFLFIFTHKLWLRNIYNRMMKVRYEQMESFRSSR